MKLGSKLANQVAALNTLGTVPEMDDQLYVMGFGLDSTNSFPDRLQQLTYDYVQLCQNRFDKYNPTLHLCADADGFQGTCAGDGGSPAVLAGPNGISTSTVVGLNSFSDDLCPSQTFDVYTRISTYADWVQGQICRLASNKPSSCSDADCIFFAPLLRSFFDASNSLSSYFGF